MKTLNSTLLLSALGVALLASPAFAQKPHHQEPQQQSQGITGNDVVLDGQVIGADPDPQIRSQILREWDSREGE